MNILEVKNLNMSYKTIDGMVEAVKNISFSVKEGSTNIFRYDISSYFL